MLACTVSPHPNCPLCVAQGLPFLSDVDEMDHKSNVLFYNIKTMISSLEEGLQEWGGTKLPQSAAKGLHRVRVAIRSFVRDYEACEFRDPGFVHDGRSHKCKDLIVDLDEASATMQALDRVLRKGFTWGDTIRWSPPMAILYSELLAITWQLDSEKYAFIPPEFFL